MVLKIHGSPTITGIGLLCRKYYQCADDEFELGDNFRKELSVVVKHGRLLDGGVRVSVAQDLMSVSVTMYPGINGGVTPSKEEIYKLIVDDNNIYKEIFNEEAFSHAYDVLITGQIVDNIVLAKGYLPIDGVDGSYELYFEIPSSRPKYSETGKTHLKELGLFVNVCKDQLLARVKLPLAGSPGRNVYGSPILQRKGKEVELYAGDGVLLAGQELYANMDGCVIFDNKTISIRDSIIISKNVDFSTGNIDFIGNVEIQGDVLPGFRVKGKNVKVFGVCQGAEIIADENIEILRGTKGVNPSSSVQAGGDISIGYAENTVISAKGSVTVNKYAYNCILNTGVSVYCADGGVISGGEVNTFSGGSFYKLGSKANTSLVVNAGKKFDMHAKLALIDEEVKKLYANLDKVTDALSILQHNKSDVQKNSRVASLVEIKSALEKKLEQLQEQALLINKESICRSPIIEVRGLVHEGVVLQMFSSKLFVKHPAGRVEYYYSPEHSEVRGRNIL